MKLNAEALAEKEAKKASAPQDNEGGRDDNMVTPSKATKPPPSPPSLKRRAPPGVSMNTNSAGSNPGEVMYDWERFRPVNIPFDPIKH